MRKWRGVAKSGRFKAECDQCGWDYHSHDLREDWQGFMKCPTCWERRHPQDFVRGVTDDPSPPWARLPKETGSTGDGVTFIEDSNFTITTNTDNLIIYDTTMTANRSVTLATSNFFKGDRATVVKNDGTSFTIDVGTGIFTLTTDSKIEVEFDGSAWNKNFVKIDTLSES